MHAVSHAFFRRHGLQHAKKKTQLESNKLYSKTIMRSYTQIQSFNFFKVTVALITLIGSYACERQRNNTAVKQTSQQIWRSPVEPNKTVPDATTYRFILTSASISLNTKPENELQVDTIVNAANTSLQGGGGIDGAIHRAAGPELKKACSDALQKQGKHSLPYGEALATKSYGLKKAGIQYVIHAVGPDACGGRYNDMELSKLVYQAYYNSMKAMNNLIEANATNPPRSIGFPMIAVGIYSVPSSIAGPAAIRAIRQGLKDFPKIEQAVLFGAYDQDAQNQERFAAFLERFNACL